MKKKAIYIMMLISFSFCLAQQKDISKYLDKRNDIHTVYESKSSILIRTKENKLELVDLETGEKKILHSPKFDDGIIHFPNDKYLLSSFISDSRRLGIILDKEGNQQKIYYSTSNVEISENGNYIITTQPSALGGYFQLFNANTLEEISIPVPKYPSFGAKFLDTNRIFIVYSVAKTQLPTLNLDSLKTVNIKLLHTKKIDIREYLRRTRPLRYYLSEKEEQEYVEAYVLCTEGAKLFNSGKITEKEYSERNLRGRNIRREASEKRTERRKKLFQSDELGKYLVYNIERNRIETEGFLDIEGKTFKIFEERFMVGISPDKENLLLAASNNSKVNTNSLIQINLKKNSIKELTNIYGLSSSSDISFIKYFSENEIFVSSLENRTSTFCLNKNGEVIFAKLDDSIRPDLITSIRYAEGKVVISDYDKMMITWDTRTKSVASSPSVKYIIHDSTLEKHAIMEEKE